VSKAKVTAGAGVLTLATGLIVAFEGYYPGTYADPVGIPTSCYGHVGPENTPGRRFSEGECKALLEGDLSEAFSHVARCIKVPLKDYEAAALTSAAYNAGQKIVCGSTLQRKANAGDKAGMCAELSKWVYARGIKLRGLVRRRAAERAMCEGRV
jgi:lysozyme